MEPLISNRVAESLRLIVQYLFLGNRIVDRIMDNLAVPLVMTKSEQVLHDPIAHKYLNFVDEVGNYAHSRNQMIGYLETPADMTIYSSPLAAFQKYLDYQIELEDLIQESMNIASEEGDKMTKKFLNKLLLEINAYTNEALLLVDKATMYGNDKFAWMVMDSNAEDLLLPELQSDTEVDDD